MLAVSLFKAVSRLFKAVSSSYQVLAICIALAHPTAHPTASVYSAEIRGFLCSLHCSLVREETWKLITYTAWTHTNTHTHTSLESIVSESLHCLDYLMIYYSSKEFPLLTSRMRLRSVVSACTRWKLAISPMGRKPSWSIFLRRKKSRSRLSRLK